MERIADRAVPAGKDLDAAIEHARAALAALLRVAGTAKARDRRSSPRPGLCCPPCSSTGSTWPPSGWAGTPPSGWAGTPPSGWAGTPPSGWAATLPRRSRPFAPTATKPSRSAAHCCTGCRPAIRPGRRWRSSWGGSATTAIAIRDRGPSRLTPTTSMPRVTCCCTPREIRTPTSARCCTSCSRCATGSACWPARPTPGAGGLEQAPDVPGPGAALRLAGPAGAQPVGAQPAPKLSRRCPGRARRWGWGRGEPPRRPSRAE
jgi:hypothetical protein